MSLHYANNYYEINQLQQQIDLLDNLIYLTASKNYFLLNKTKELVIQKKERLKREPIPNIIGLNVATRSGRSMQGRTVRCPQGITFDNGFICVELDSNTSCGYAGEIAILDRQNLEIIPVCKICKLGASNKKEYCFRCNIWRENVKKTPRNKEIQFKEGDKGVYFIAKNIYADNNTGKVDDVYNLYYAQNHIFADTKFCGSGGRLVEVVLKDGQTIRSNNLSCCGQIPQVWIKAFLHLEATLICK